MAAVHWRTAPRKSIGSHPCWGHAAPDILADATPFPDGLLWDSSRRSFPDPFPGPQTQDYCAGIGECGFRHRSADSADGTGQPMEPIIGLISLIG